MRFCCWGLVMDASHSLQALHATAKGSKLPAKQPTWYLEAADDHIYMRDCIS